MSADSFTGFYWGILAGISLTLGIVWEDFGAIFPLTIAVLGWIALPAPSWRRASPPVTEIKED